MSVKVIVRSSSVFWSAPSWARSAFDLSSYQEAFRLGIELLRPASMFAFLLAIWRLSSDLGWTNDFLFSEGLASHWQIWAALGAAMLAIQHNSVRRQS
jgi:hypothetical protein